MCTASCHCTTLFTGLWHDRKKVCRFRCKPAPTQVDGATTLVVSGVVEDVQYTVLIDPSSQVFALAPSSFFENKEFTLAARPL